MKLSNIKIALLLLCMTSIPIQAFASLIIIGSASYNGSEYNLIYDDDKNGFDGGGLIWLDYTNPNESWEDQNAWANDIGSYLTVTLNEGISTDIDWTSGWRLPETIDGNYIFGYEGDPDNDGIYSYTRGYNLANSELGHLYYTELENIGYQNTDGSYNEIPSGPDYLFQNPGLFENLLGDWYWTCTAYENNPGDAWYFGTRNGIKNHSNMSMVNLGVAVLDGTVTIVPLPAGLYPFAIGFIWLLGFRKSRNDF